jgi:hypothetical protein
MSEELGATNESIAELEAKMWPLMRKKGANAPEVEALRDQIHELWSRRRTILAGISTPFDPFEGEVEVNTDDFGHRSDPHHRRGNRT